MRKFTFSNWEKWCQYVIGNRSVCFGNASVFWRWKLWVLKNPCMGRTNNLITQQDGFLKWKILSSKKDFNTQWCRARDVKPLGHGCDWISKSKSLNIYTNLGLSFYLRNFYSAQAEWWHFSTFFNVQMLFFFMLHGLLKSASTDGGKIPPCIISNMSQYLSRTTYNL